MSHKNYLRLCLIVAFCGVAIISVACEQSVPANKLPTLTTVDQIRSLKPEEAERGYPVQLHGVATYDDAADRMLVVQDSTAAILIDVSKTQMPIKIGQDVSVAGITSRGESSNSVI